MLGNRQIRRNDSDSSESDNIEDRDTRHEREISIQEEIVDFLRSFPDLRLYYNITTKIGEGTFSSVYSAVELNHRYSNEWCSCSDENCGLVAIKRLYVTSSPQRLYNEINMVAMFEYF